jgi:hypothetical protein
MEGIIFYMKCTLSTCIVFSALLFVIYGLFKAEKRIKAPRPVLALLLMLSLSFLGYFESGQVAVINLSTIDSRQSHKLAEKVPLAYRVYQSIARPGAVERYLIGRQLCVIALVFFISRLTSFPTMPNILPAAFEHVLIRTGLPGVMITLTIGQLFPQLVADEFTVRFLNLKGSLLFVKIGQFIESIGIFTHSSWLTSYVLIHYVFQWKEPPEHASDNPIESLDISRSAHNLIWSLQDLPIQSSSGKGFDRDPEKVSVPEVDADRSDVNLEQIEQMNPYHSGLFTSLLTLFTFIASGCLTALAAVLILNGLAFNTPLLRAPRWVLFSIFVVCTVAEFYLEGCQVAVLAIQHRDVSTLGNYGSNAVKIHKLVTDHDGVKRFLVGRQFLIVLSMFTMSSITTYHSLDDYSQHFFPEHLIRTLVLTGFIGVLFCLNTVQLPAQMIAKQYPTRFLNLPGLKQVVQLALFAESTGIMHFGWLLFHAGKYFFRE